MLTGEQRVRIAKLLHWAFIEIRALAAEGRAEQIGDLSDAFHNLPVEALGWKSWSLDVTRGMLEGYQEKYHGRQYLGKFDYVRELDAIILASS